MTSNRADLMRLANLVASTRDETLVRIVAMRPSKQVSVLMGKIASARAYGRPIPECWIEALSAVCDPKRFRKWKTRFNRKAPAAAISASRVPPVRVTRTVRYVYRVEDNARLQEFYQSPEWRMMRYEALRLHGARCQCCGTTPRDGARLTVDHIKPLRVFWGLRLDLSNLQVLCDECNQGKGARHDDDWRQQGRADA